MCPCLTYNMSVLPGPVPVPVTSQCIPRALEPLRITSDKILSFSLPLRGISTEMPLALHFAILTGQRRWHEQLCSTWTVTTRILDSRQAEAKVVSVSKSSLGGHCEGGSKRFPGYNFSSALEIIAGEIGPHRVL